MKTKLFIVLNLLVGLIGASNASLADDCAPESKLTWVKATYAESGDMVIIQGERFRLIGVQAPQIQQKQKFNTPGQPLAKESQLFLNKLLANNDMEVGVEYDTTKVDPFNHQLAHLFLRDGTNVQEKILENGYVLALTSHQNTRHARCYFEAEQRARSKGYGLWDVAEKHPEFHFPIVKSSELRKQDDGFRIISGVVDKVEKSSTNYIVNLDTTGIRVPKDYWNRFDFSALQALQGKRIEVRGQSFFYKGAMYVVIDNPNAINLLNPLNRK
ncbi:thermonuclease family protein [Thiomicrorhabdus sp. ZW0627]|uniref:thermonuclease family protein n=1 Tax=Thiomicrorhabdus sp. ZW0627 TaxID=3039774 RepID=UPI0024364739|nr:thermonuclease family protein [Thiomicrorhabdus sp. ZW0627]MDG6774364.1 thermonuclease family protein [Thiomicrorhabdus sp. ZW0627]